jgi:muramoyltetrapeptide carboxypeptidase
MRIAVVLPSGPIRPGAEREAFDAGLDWLRAEGHEPVLGAPLEVLPEAPWLAASDRARAEALVAASRSDAELLWMGRGGYGAARTLAALAAMGGEGLAATPLFGFSDGTALLGYWAGRGWSCWSAPPIVQLGRLDGDSRARLRDALEGRVAPFSGLETMLAGVAEGPLVGGNLAVLSSLAGTPAMPRLGGGILVVEDVGEPAYKVDRMLHQLLFSGALEGVVGLVAGAFTGVSADEQERVAAAILAFARRLGAPAARGLPVGHDSANAALPLEAGWSARLDAGGALATLEIQRAST